MKLLRLSLLSTLLGMGLSVGNSPSAWAEATLTSAEVYRAQNDVTLNRQNRGSWNPAAVGDSMIPQDALRTGARSRAELLFNEGTLVRTGEGTTFRFPSGQRSFELINGSSLLIIRPGLGASRITTPEAVIVASGTALFVQHDPTRNASVVGVLTESPAGPVTVTDASGEVSVQLSAGQFVSVANGVVGFIEYFILPVFYDTVELAAGLAPGQESFVSQQSAAVQETLNAVRAESIGPFNNQVTWMGGLCQQGLGTLQPILQQTPLLQTPLLQTPLTQWLWPGTLPPEQITVEIPSTDLLVTPIRSLTGIAWLGNYCTSQRRTSQ